jgi:histidine kinase
MNHVRQYTRDGTPLYARIRVAESVYTGNPVILLITSDVTKQLEAEQQLIQASKMATLGEMATGVAHELNQPLAVIKSASNFFIRKIDNGGAIAEDILQTMCLEIDRHVDRATKIINHMREFGRKSDLALVPVHIDEVMKKAFEMFSQQLKVRGIEVQWDLAEELPAIMGDPDRLEQVFINLLINARDAIEERSGRDGRDAEKRIAMHTSAPGEGGTVVVEVWDTGIGIPEKMRNKLFEPFFTTKDVGKGTGLGLSISYGIVKDCGGTIDAVERDGGGACFRMRFPAAV